MKILSKLLDVALYAIAAISLLSAISSAIWDKPMFLTAVRSNSMYPLFERSDMLMIQNLSNNSRVSIGDIVVFRVEDGNLSSKGWIVHRIIGGDSQNGYITKGDANDYTDQESGGTGLIKREWIVSKVITLNNQPLKIPLIGYLSLWMEQFQTNPYTMPIISSIIAVIVGINELTSYKKNARKKGKKRKSNILSLTAVYVFSGLTISIIMCASMLASSQNIIVPYVISENGNGVVMGSDIGIIRVGERIENPLSQLSNKGFFPIISTITSKDPHITFNQSKVILKPGNNLDVNMMLYAQEIGNYKAIIHVGMFYPFLPSNVIYKLANINYWLALLFVSLIPGLPLMLYPIFEPRLRRKTIKEIRRVTRRILRKIPILN